jgi:hypothetical protein
MAMNVSRSSVYAIALREELNLTGSIDLFAIAEKFRLSIREIELTGCDGALLRSSIDSSGIIAVKNSIRESGRKRFTVAHEIGHRVLHGASTACSAADIANWSENAKQAEKEADEFAAELLLPAREIAPTINSRSPSLNVIQSVAQKYEASFSASAWRYCDIAATPCAVIWSTKKIVQWARRSDSFRIFLRRGVEVPQGSYARAAYEGKDVPGDPEPVAADEWIDNWNLREGAEIWEQSLRLHSYDSVITLLWIKREIVQTTTEEDSLLDELDAEDFTLRRKRWPGNR